MITITTTELPKRYELKDCKLSSGNISFLGLQWPWKLKSPKSWTWKLLEQKPFKGNKWERELGRARKFLICLLNDGTALNFLPIELSVIAVCRLYSLLQSSLYSWLEMIVIAEIKKKPWRDMFLYEKRGEDVKRQYEARFICKRLNQMISDACSTWKKSL